MPALQERIDGYFREYALDHVSSGPAIVAVDEDDNIWVALAKSGKLARFSNGAIELFEIGAESRPVGLAVGTKANGHTGTIWIAASYDNKIIQFNTASRQKHEFKIEGEKSWPFIVGLGPDGSVWFTQRASSKIGRLYPATGEMRHYDVPTPNAGPAGLAVDPRSGRVWFTQSYADRIGVLEPDSGRIHEYSMGDSSTGLVSGPAGIALDSQGGVWFAKLEGKLGYLAPGSEHIDIIDVPQEAKRPAGIAVAADGDIWVLALDGNLLLRYRPSTQRFILYPVPTGEPDERPNVPPIARTSRPFGISIDRQGNVWFSQQYTGQLAVLDIAPPMLSVLSPVGTVRTADVLLTVRALDRVAGVEHLAISLDGKAVTVARGRLDLGNLLPGQHKLEVTAVDAAGHSTTAAADFDYAPGQHALLDILRRVEPIGTAGEAAKATLLAIAQELSKGEIESRLDQIRRILAKDAKFFRPFSSEVLHAVIEFQLRNAGQSVDVRILDGPPYFSQMEVIVRKGDTVRWRYDPPSDGHSISHNLHRIEIQSIQVRSGMLRAGETFSHRFEQVGEFLVTNTEQRQSSAVIKVTNQ